MDYRIDVVGLPTIIVFEPWADELHLARGQRAVIEFDPENWRRVGKIEVSAEHTFVWCLAGALVRKVEVDGEAWKSPITEMPAMFDSC